uniref:Uncharacterized protein n=1 Tax=Anopheles darlingi TaxID=43151 RepID=A0A2M4D3I0_ANODA
MVFVIEEAFGKTRFRIFVATFVLVLAQLFLSAAYRMQQAALSRRLSGTLVGCFDDDGAALLLPTPPPAVISGWFFFALLYNVRTLSFSRCSLAHTLAR